MKHEDHNTNGDDKHNIFVVNVKEKDHLGDHGVDCRKIPKWATKMGCEGADWIKVAQDRNPW
jgi:hypothetical protein